MKLKTTNTYIDVDGIEVQLVVKQFGIDVLYTWHCVTMVKTCVILHSVDHIMNTTNALQHDCKVKLSRYNTAFVKQIHICKYVRIYTSWKHFCCWINVEKIMPLLLQEALSYKMSDVYFMNPISEGSFGVDKEILVLHILLNYAYKIQPYYYVECNCINTLPLMAHIKTSNTLLNWWTTMFYINSLRSMGVWCNHYCSKTISLTLPLMHKNALNINLFL